MPAGGHGHPRRPGRDGRKPRGAIAPGSPSSAPDAGPNYLATMAVGKPSPRCAEVPAARRPCRRARRTDAKLVDTGPATLSEGTAQQAPIGDVRGRANLLSTKRWESFGEDAGAACSGRSRFDEPRERQGRPGIELSATPKPPRASASSAPKNKLFSPGLGDPHFYRDASEKGHRRPPFIGPTSAQLFAHQSRWSTTPPRRCFSVMA